VDCLTSKDPDAGTPSTITTG